jgi:long-chain acyl-CoA synthetase
LVSDESSFAISYTSGTTGQPKGIMLSHRSRALSFLAAAAEYGCYGPEDHAIAVAPLYHGGGFVFGVAPLFTGGCCTILSSFDPERLLHYLEVTHATNIFVVPTHVSAVFALPSTTLNRHRFPALKTIISNAAPLPQSAKEQMVAYFGEGILYECYGSTEAGIVTNIRPTDILRKPDSVGQPFPCTEIAILDNDGQPVPAGDKGHVYSRSPYLFNGYWNKPDETAQVWRNGWVTAGDLGRQDEDGFLYIEGRAKDMIITGGINVYPKEIENVLTTFAGISEAAVVGIPDAHWGERVVAFLVSDQSEPDLAALGTHCKAQLSNFKIPKEYRIVDDLPRNPTGKLLRRVLREQF